ncbi:MULTISPECIES: glycosyltransferase [Salipiger]|uniref:glycosyltransferase n=1 Tax=Salipiger TaxID=263377 RepID=UPI00097633BB|nr:MULTISPECIES: glycosyltransferase [Salipiger]
MVSTTRRNVVFFVLPALHGGGAERVTLALLRAFQDSYDWHPILVLTTNRKGLLDDQIPENTEVIRLDASSGRRAIPKLLKLIRSFEPDIVFASLDHVNATLGIIQPLFSSKTSLVLRATSFRSLKSNLMRVLLSWSFRRANMVVFQSEQMRLSMVRMLRLPKEHANTVVPNPLDRSKIQSLAATDLDPEAVEFWGLNQFESCKRLSSPKLVAAGGVYWAKGFDLLVDAIRILGREDIRVAILGQGEQEEEIRRKIEDAGLQNQIRMFGFQRNPYAWFARADGFVLSSRVEGFPNVVLEALACGCPVIGTPMPGLEGLQGCRLSSDISAEALSKVIGSFLSAPHSSETETSLAPFDVSAVQKHYEMIFNSLVSKGS